MLFQDATIVNGQIRPKSWVKDVGISHEKYMQMKRDAENDLAEATHKNDSAGIKEAKALLSDIEKDWEESVKVNKDSIQEDSYTYKGIEYEKKELWDKLKEEGKTKKFFTLSAQEKVGRDGQYIIYQAPSGELFAVTRDTADIKLNETPDSEFDAKELALGIKTEMEHTDNLQEATSIAKDHLQELPDYYSKLVKMEAKDAERIDLKCTYANGDIIRTGFNGTLQDAKDYFLNKTFNLGQGENDKMVKCIKVEQV